MTQRTLYILMFALGGVMLTLPVFGTSITSTETSLTTVESSADTLFFPAFTGEFVPHGVLLKLKAFFILSDGELEMQHLNVLPDATAIDFSNFSTIAVLGDIDIDELEPSSDLRLFSYLHRSPSNGINYYRLRITDASGNVSYSPIIAMFLDLAPGSISPNPIDMQATLSIESSVEEPGELNVYDMAGRLIYSESVILNENTTLIGLDFSGWDRGHYVVTLSGEQLGNEVIRFVKR